MTPALFHPNASEALDLFMGSSIGTARDLYELDGETALFRRDGRVETWDIETLSAGGRP